MKEHPPLFRIKAKTLLKFGPAYERKGAGFQCRLKEISSFEGGTGETTFPHSWPSTPPREIRSSRFHLFFRKGLDEK
jgi:hypothetical protein